MSFDFDVFVALLKTGVSGGTIIGTKLVGGKEIGKTIDTGGGMGIDAGGGYCEAWQMSEHSEWITDVKLGQQRWISTC